jgi:hypothetical protein
MTVSDMRKARGNPASIFIQFTRRFKQYTFALFCFYEGKDCQYYSVRVKTIAQPKKDIFFDCRGKFGVLEVRRMISSRKEYENANVAYFIDRDFDKSIYVTEVSSISSIYETPCHSVENFYTSVSAFREILKTEFHFEEFDKDFQKLENLYLERQSDFHKHIGLLNSWIACQSELGSSARLNLGNYSLSEFVSITLDKVEVKYNPDKLASKFIGCSIIPSEVLDQKLNELKSAGCGRFFRGKFEIEFLFIFLKDLRDEANKRASPYFSERRKKVNLQISKDSMISDLSQCADTPECLYNFLKSFSKD